MDEHDFITNVVVATVLAVAALPEIVRLGLGGHTALIVGGVLGIFAIAWFARRASRDDRPAEDATDGR